jgi:hypothetical protein
LCLETENKTAASATRRPNADAAEKRPGNDRRGKIHSRPRTGGNSRRKMATQRKSHPVARLLETLEAEEIRFMLIGMSAAIVQGVMGTTLDVDLWLDLPARQYMRVQNLVYAKDGTPVNFVYEVNGLGTFQKEFKHSVPLSFRGKKIPVLKLERILKSKESIRRDQDLPHIIHIRDLLKCRRALKTKTSQKK